MSHVHEFRVRPVNRFVLTEYRRHVDGPGQASGAAPRTIAELPNADLADALGEALQRANPGSSLTRSDGSHEPASGLQYVLVEAHKLVPDALAYYAEDWDAALALKVQLQRDHGREFRIFWRTRELRAGEVVGGVFEALQAGAMLVEMEKPHTQYPARFRLDERALRAASTESLTGVGQNGIATSHPAEPAVVVGIHFYSHKVCYDVTYPSGRRGETVDSTELSDLPAAACGE